MMTDYLSWAKRKLGFYLSVSFWSKKSVPKYVIKTFDLMGRNQCYICNQFFSDMLDDLFPKKLRLGDPPKPKGKQSLLTMKIQTSPKPKENPFTDFSPYDAYDRPPSESMNVRVLLTALQEFQEPEDSTDSGKTIHNW